jgi:hypothetical protein
MSRTSQLKVAFVIGGCSLLIACNPREMPGFKQIAKREDARITRETDEAIQNSPGLQELERLCTLDIPSPTDFVLVQKSRDFNEQKFLIYYYRSGMTYERVKTFYSDFLRQHGWQLTEQKDCCWGPSKLVFRRDSFSVTIYDKEYGEDTSYVVECSRL